MATLKEDAIIVLGIGLGVVMIAWYLKNKAGDALAVAKDATKYIDPTSDQNIAYQSSSALARWLSGSDGSLGTIMFDYAHKGEPDANGNAINYTAAQQAADLEATRRLELGYHGM